MALIQITCVVAFLCYAALVFPVARSVRRRPEGRHFLLYLFGMLAWQSAQTLVAFTRNSDVALQGYRIVAGVAPLFGFAYVMFVRDMLAIRTRRFRAPIGYLFTTITALTFGLSATQGVVGVYEQGDLPLFLPVIGIGPTLTGIMVYGCLVYAFLLLVRARRSTPSPRAQTRLTYLMIGVPVVVVGSALNFIPAFRIYPVDMMANVVNALLMAIVILRYQLLDIHVVIGKGLRYSATTVVVGTVYFAIVSLAVQVFHFVAGYQMAVLSVVMGVLAAVMVQPLRLRMQAYVDRKFFREKYDATQVFERLSSTAVALLEPEALAMMILTEVRNALHVARGAYYLKNASGAYELIASAGAPPDVGQTLRADHPVTHYLQQHRQVVEGQVITGLPLARAFRLEERTQWEALEPELLVPVVAKGNLTGVLILGPKLSGTSYDVDDCLLLSTLSDQTAVAIENGKLYADIQRQLAEREHAEARILESLHEKEVLLKEIHHRVKNNLQVVYSLLSLQGRQATDPSTLEVLRDSQNRIRSMALIHERLYLSENLAVIDFGEYLPSLSKDLYRSFAVDGRRIHLIADNAQIQLPLDVALPCALIASELISNALKHAYTGRTEGELRVHLRQRADHQVELEVSDDGVGMPAEDSVRAASTLGMQLIGGLVRQLEGSLSVDRTGGTRCRVAFPAPSVSPVSVASPRADVRSLG